MALHKIYHLDIEIRDSDIDILGHVNNVAFVGWMQKAAIAHSDANGWDWMRYKQLGISWVARSHCIEYLASVFRNESLYVETWVSEMKRVSSTRDYWFFKRETGERVAQAQTRWALIELSNSHPIRIPKDMAGDFHVVQRSTKDFSPDQ